MATQPIQQEPQEAEAEVAKRLVDIRIYEVPEEDWLAFKRVMAAYGWNKAIAFRALLDAYYASRELGDQAVKLDALAERVQRLEEAWRRNEAAAEEEEPEEEKKLGTFGGG